MNRILTKALAAATAMVMVAACSPEGTGQLDPDVAGTTIVTPATGETGTTIVGGMGIDAAQVNDMLMEADRLRAEVEATASDRVTSAWQEMDRVITDLTIAAGTGSVSTDLQAGARAAITEFSAAIQDEGDVNETLRNAWENLRTTIESLLS